MAKREIDRFRLGADAVPIHDGRDGRDVEFDVRSSPRHTSRLRTLCADGLQRFIAEAEAALADDRDAWPAFADFMRRAVEADTNSLTAALAGTFTPTQELFAQAARANELLTAVFDRARDAIRPDLEVHDLSLIFEQLAAIKTGDAQRTLELRRRYLALVLDGVRARPGKPLPGPPPTWEEITARWST